MAIHTPTPERAIALGDLADTDTVAGIIGVSSRHVVAALIARRTDFPAPAIQVGTIRLWVKSDIEAWNENYRANQRRDYTRR